MKRVNPHFILLLAALAVLAGRNVSAAPACKKGEQLVVVKERKETDKGIQLVLLNAKTGKKVMEGGIATKMFPDEAAKYAAFKQGATVCWKDEGED